MTVTRPRDHVAADGAGAPLAWGGQTVALLRYLADLVAEGWQITADQLGQIAPYLRARRSPGLAGPREVVSGIRGSGR